MAELPRLLILGGAGYLGSRISAALAGEYQIFVTYRSLPQARKRWLAQVPSVTAVSFDSPLPDVPFDVAINLAMPSAEEARKDEEGSLAQALRVSEILTSLAGQGRLRRLLHFSTFHVYGTPARERYAEQDEPRPQHPYGRVHLACENKLREASHMEELWIVRPTNIVTAPAHADLGPQSRVLFLDLCRQAVQSRRMVLHNDGLSYRDFLPFDDALAAIRLFLTNPPGDSSILNLSGGVSSRLSEVCEMIANGAVDTLGFRPELAFGTGIDDYRVPFQVCNQRLHDLGWKPRGDLELEADKILTFFAGTS